MSTYFTTYYVLNFLPNFQHIVHLEVDVGSRCFLSKRHTLIISGLLSHPFYLYMIYVPHDATVGVWTREVAARSLLTNLDASHVRCDDLVNPCNDLELRKHEFQDVKQQDGLEDVT